MSDKELAEINILKNELVKICPLLVHDSCSCSNTTCCACIANDLYNIGYRKVDKNELIIRKDGTVKQEEKEEVIEFFVKHNAEVRKEVFNKILSCIKEKRNSLTYTTQDSKIQGQCEAYSDMENILRELAKEYGVEVEEQ